MLFLKILARVILGSHPVRIKSLLLLMRISKESGFERIANFISNLLKPKGIYVSANAIISDTVNFPHPIAIVIGEGVIIESNVKIYQNVTLGGARQGDWRSDNYPVIGANTVIYAGAVVVGKIRVGRNCVIGANSVVLSDVPDNSVCVGAPAKVLSVNRVKE
jgi:serine O-acetyltransferase